MSNGPALYALVQSRIARSAVKTIKICNATFVQMGIFYQPMLAVPRIKLFVFKNALSLTLPIQRPGDARNVPIHAKLAVLLFPVSAVTTTIFMMGYASEKITVLLVYLHLFKQ